MNTSFEKTELKIEKNKETKKVCSNPKEFKAKELASSFQEIESFCSSSKVLTFALDGLSENTTKESIKKDFEGLHIVNIDTEVDNLTGVCKGKSTVVVRAKETDEKKLESLKTQLANKGILMTEPVINNGIKSKYENLTNIQ